MISYDLPEDEAMVLLSLKCFESCLGIYLTDATHRLQISDTESVIPHSLAGPFLAQIVQSSLIFARHQAKGIAFMSLQIVTTSVKLTTLYDAVPRRYSTGTLYGYTVWRTYYPGIFSGLFTLCTSKGSMTSNSVKAAAVALLLEITTVIIQDNIHQKLLNVQMKSSAETSAEKFLRSISQPSEAAVETVCAGVLDDPGNLLENSKEELHAENMPFIDPTEAWRVDILQKLEKFLPILYHSLTPSVGTKLILTKCILRLLVHCQQFLGRVMRSILFELLLEGLNDDNPTVRETVKGFISFLEGTLPAAGTASICNVKFMFWDELRSG